MKLNAKSRLLADEAGGQSDAAKQAKENLDRQLENKKSQVENLKKTMPSKENKMAVNPVQKNQTEKQIHRTQEDMSELRLRKSEIGK